MPISPKDLENLSPEAKRELLETLLRQKAAKQGNTAQPLSRRSHQGPVPLTFAQRGVWMAQQLQPETSSYHVPGAFRVVGPLDVGVLRRCLKEIHARHVILRATMRSTEDGPVQSFSEPGEIELPVVDLTGLAAEAQQAELDRRVEEVANHPFDLAQGPLSRVALFRTGSAEHVLVVTMHHLVCDAWSHGLLVRELCQLYEALHAGKSSPLPELPIQFADYAVWHREWLGGPGLQPHLDYWREQFQPRPEELDLPVDRPVAPQPSSEGANSSELCLSPETSERLRALAKKEGVSLFMLLQAGLYALLYRLTGQEDLCVCTTVAGRSRVETEPLIGNFVNRLILRAQVSGQMTFKELVERVRELVMSGFDHQEVPFERVLQELRIPREPGRLPFARVAFNLDNTLPMSGTFAGLSLTPLLPGSRHAALDLMLSMVDSPTGISGVFQYRTALFDRETVDRLLGGMMRLLEEAAIHPHTRVGELPLLSEEEQVRLLAQSAGRAVEIAPDALIHRAFEAQVRRAPDAVALWVEGRSVSYGDLNARANALARQLRRSGVGPEVRVGLCLERSAEMIVAVLATLKAGGAYVPLDPAYPAERLSFMVEDCAPSVILCQKQTANRIAAEGPPKLVLDDEAVLAALDAEPAGELEGGAGPTNLAYVIYTSGSTGRPKGVLVEHRGAISLSSAHTRLFAAGPGCRVLQWASFSFDASVWDLLMSLLTGGALVLERKEDLLPGPALLSTLRERRVTHLTIAPSSLAALPEERLQDLKVLICAGEALDSELVARWSADRRFFNAYGPTETTICATVSEPLRPGHRPAIGVPVENAQVYLLDPGMRLVPPGVAGELYVGGVGVARGYLGRPELTAERFVPDPFGSEPGGRLYRTGDLGRWRTDGRIEYLGRVDRQVKIRGFRVEPGEIDAALLRHRSVKSATVIVRDDGGMGRRLVAYVVPRVSPLDETALRTFLHSQLPEHLIPAVFVALDALPLTPNHKIDVRALPAPERVRPNLASAFVPARAPAEVKLAALFEQVLGREGIGVNDNFFELGGDSINALWLVSQAAKEGLRLDVQQVFRTPTIAELAGAVAHAAPGEGAAEQGLVTGEVPLSPIQRWLLEEGRDPHHFNQDHLLELQRPLSSDILRRALEALVRHHDALRLRVQKTGGGWTQSNAGLEGAPELHEVDLSHVPETELAAKMIELGTLAQGALRLDGGVLLRATVMRLGPGRKDRFHLVVHHLAVDVISWRFLLEDLEHLCLRLEQGEPAQLPAKTASFKDFAQRLFTRAQAESAQAELAYWSGKHWETSAPLRPDGPGGENLVRSERVLSSSLSSEQTEALVRTLPGRFKANVQEVLLAALVDSVCRSTGGAALSVAMEGHGRQAVPDLDVSRTVGWFTSLYPVLLAKGETGLSTLKAVKEELRRIPGKGGGFGLLRYLSEDAGVRQKLAATRWPEVGFNYLGQAEEGLGTAGLFGVLPEKMGYAQSPAALRPNRVGLDARVEKGRLHLEWSYSENLYRKESIEALAAAFERSLQALIQDCLSGKDRGLTPSDFPLANLTPSTLDAVATAFPDLEDVFALSPLQQGLVFHSLQEARGEVYLCQNSFALEGRLDTSAFDAAWQRMAELHPLLRTSYFWEGQTELLQVVRRQVKVPIERLDWSRHSADEQRRRLDPLVEEDLSTKFELGAFPYRIRLIQLADLRHHVVFSFHSSLMDGWSTAAFYDDLFELYEAIRGERAPSLPARRPFKDYLAWLATRDEEKAQTYWRKALEGFTAPTVLPLDHPSIERGTPSEEILALTEEQTQALRELARSRQITLNTVVQAAWGLLLAQHSGATDVVFGAIVAGRPAELTGVGEMVGLFTNVVPVRLRLDPHETAEALVSRLHAEAMEARAFEHSPLVQIQRWSAVPRGQALFESLVLFQNFPDDETGGAPRSLKISGQGGMESTHYPLALFVTPGAQLQLQLVHGEQVEKVTARRLLERLRAWLGDLAQRKPASAIGLAALGAEERRTLLLDWNETQVPLDADATAPAMFEQQVERTPNARALVSAGRAWTYEELNRRADQLAHRLVAMGVGPEVRVGVCLDRGLELPMVLLAIHKAGGAYVPLDPSFPAERISFMVEDARPAVVVTSSSLASLLPKGCPVLKLDAEADALSRQPKGPVSQRPSGKNAAYVLYTSGSTGRPKGVVVEHANLANFLIAMDARLEPKVGGVWLAVTSISFDISALELFWTLSRGFTVVVQPKDAGELIGAEIVRHGVTHLQCTPSMARLVMGAEGGPEALQGLERLLIGGEAFPTALAEKLRETVKGELHNMYGPTETTIWSSTHEVERVSGSVSIGTPIANTTFYVVDPSGRPVPIGAAGELYIGGEGVARGYLGRPELTAERFVPDPFGDTAGGRLYRTGDLVRYLGDGSVEYLGRLDQQVKIRGHRIELGEIEAVLQKQPGVKDAAVAVREDTPGDKRLVGYVVAKQGPVDFAALREAAKRQLPEYMVPIVFVALDALPLTPNKKVDRKALPSPIALSPEPGATSSVAPRSEVEKTLAGIWEELLARQCIGVHDNFFELGGDSILTIHAVARAARAGIRFSVAQLLAGPTIAQVSAVATTAAPALPQAAAEVVTGAVRLTPIQHWFLDRAPAEPHHYNQDFVFDVRETITVAQLEKALHELALHHDALRMSFLQLPKSWRQINLGKNVKPQVQEVDLTQIPLTRIADEIQRHGTIAHATLNLTSGALVKATLFRLGRGRSDRLHLVIHHLVVDIVSWGVLVEDLQTLLRQDAGASPALPPKTLSFKEYADRLFDWAQTDEAHRELPVWQGMSWTDTRPLPKDLPGENARASDKQVVHHLDPELTQLLVREVPGTLRVTPQELLLSALVETLAEWSDAGALAVNLEGHGRDDEIAGDITRTVGWFTALYPVVFPRTARPMETLKGVREQLRRAPRRGIGFGALRYLSERPGVRQQLAALPVPEVMFNYLGTRDDAGSADGSLLQIRSDSAGATESARGTRPYALFINARVTLGRLEIDWSFSENVHRRETIQALAEELSQKIATLVDVCLAGEEQANTPADFPLAKIDQPSLDRLLKEFPDLEDVYALSPLQQGMMFHSLEEGEREAYLVQNSFELRGPLNREALWESFRRAVHRTPPLRASFQWESRPEPVQVVHRTAPQPFEEVDLRELSPQEQRLRMRALDEAEVRSRFDLRRLPLFRLRLFRLAEDRHRLAFSYHGMLLDGWSMNAFYGDLFALYEAITARREPSLPKRPPHREYIAWLQRQDPAGAEAFWRAALDGVQAATPLPYDRLSNAPGLPTRESVQLTAVQTAALGAFARRQHLTLNVLVRAAWGLLLARYAGEQDVVFGAVVAGRPADIADVELIVGQFTNVVPVRVRLRDSEKVSAFLSRLQEEQNAASAFEFAPMVQVQRWTALPRGQPLVQSLLDFQNFQDGGEEGSGATLQVVDHEAEDYNHFPLTLFVRPGAALQLDAVYNRQFDAATVQRLLRHLGALLNELASRPDATVDELSPLTSEERRQLTVEWNRTERDFPRDRCLHQLFEEQVRRAPDAIAVGDGDLRITYAELNRQANALAHRLVELGIGPEQVVAIRHQRSARLLASLLATLKAGGAVLAMDPHSPPARMKQVLQQSKARVLLVEDVYQREIAEALEGVPEGERPTVVEVSGALFEGEAADLPPRAAPRNLAYLMFTSGSTGVPKGAMVEQVGMVNHVLAKNRDLEVTAQDVLAQTATQNFDIFIFQNLAALVDGGRTQIVPDEEALLAPKLLEQIRRHGITLLNIVPSQLRALVDELQHHPDAAGAVRSLRWMVPTGEALPPELCAEWMARFPNIPLLNAYGHTECSDDQAHHRVTEVPTRATTPIGRPVQNLRIYALDGRMEPVPVGVVGELYIGGVGVGRGYLADPARTAEKFIPDPFSGESGARLYKTGDLGRWTPSGVLEMLGRVDFMVKIRGFRVELGEIEAALSKQPSVRDVTVQVRTDRPREQVLVAYVVPRPGHSLTPSQLRSHLKGLVPDHMVPASFMLLEALPLTPNGKVDRKALPSPAPVAAEAAYVAPRDPVEETLAVLWSECLGTPRVGIHDNFFDLGGHSILATQLISRVREAFGVEVPLRSIFDDPSVQALAIRVRQALVGGAPERLSLRRYDPGEAASEAPLSFSQERLWFLHQAESKDLTYLLPEAFRLKGTLDEAALSRTLTEILRRHAALRTTFPNRNGVPVQSIAPPGPIQLDRVDLSDVPASQREEEAQQSLWRTLRSPIDLSTGPLFRAMLVKLGDDQHLLGLAFHHIVTDGSSSGLFFQELCAIYGAFAAQQPSPLAELPIQYADFARWQREWLASGEMERQLDYWRKQLAGMPTSLELPTDKPRPPVRSSTGAVFVKALPAKLCASLEKLARVERATPFAAFEAAFRVLLLRYTGQEDVCIGTSVSGRSQRETEEVIGFFVNTLVLRTQASKTLTFRELLRNTREMILDAFAHQAVPFERLVHEVNPPRDMSRTPLFQVGFELHQPTDGQLRLGELQVEPLPRPGDTARLDLMLVVQASAGGQMELGFVYSTDLFEADTIERLAEHFSGLLEAVVAQPDLPLQRLPTLTEAERQTLLLEFNRTQVELDREALLPELFAKVVERSGQHPALVFAERAWSYSELDRRTRQLAHLLRSRGVGPEVRVGVCLERTLDLPMTLWAILRAGGAYVPLDPGFPQERLALMLEDARPALVITTTALSQTLPVGCQTLCLDDAVAELGKQPDLPVRVDDLHPRNAAYVLYTSGSTGRPKGVVVEHGNLTNFLYAMDERIRPEGAKVWLAVTSISFDISVLELLWPLTRGFTVVVHPKEASDQVAAALRHHGVTHLQCTPSMARMICETERGLEACARLDRLLIGGEAFPADLAERLEGAVAGELHNMYGPTETTIWSSTHRVGPEVSPVPIGKPIANTTFYVLDGTGQPVPLGAMGELYIGGEGVARGYLGRPELTAERFVPNPFADGERLYRTGDVVRYLADGSVRYLGRQDHQVKVRGHRIELEEVEAALLSHAAVMEAVVVTRPDAVGSQHLVAYVVSREEGGTSGLLGYLKGKLPEYMVPSVLMELEAMPLTPNGKIDRKALPAPTQSQTETYVAPRNPAEQTLAQIWAEFLGVERVGIHDSFFDMGGHSLLLTLVVARLRSELEVELPVRTFFELPTIAEQARYLTEKYPDLGVDELSDEAVTEMLRKMSSA